MPVRLSGAPYPCPVPTDPAPARRPAGLSASTAVVAAQGAALLGFGVWLLARRAGDVPSNEAVFEGSTAYAFVTGGLVLVVAAGLWWRRGWAYAAGVFLQLLALAVTYEMARAGFWIGAIPLALGSGVALLGLLSPSGRAALGRP